MISKKYPLYKRKTEHNVVNFKFGGNNNVLRFCEYIYQGASIYLGRKYQKYQELLEHIDVVNKQRIVHKCDICGDTESSEYYRWNHEGEYAGMTLCGRHYKQLRKHGTVTMMDRILKKQNKCTVCGDDREGIYHIYCGDGEYHDQELCRKHYDQLRRLGCIKDNIPVKHKEAA